MMSDATNATCTNDAYAIGSTLNVTQWLNDSASAKPTDCISYTGSVYKSIVASTIS